MNKIYRRFLVVIILTIITATIVFHIENIEPFKNEMLFQFPMQIDQWSGENIPMEERIFESLETPYAILRNYHSIKGKVINFSIVWYSDKEVAFHSAAACLGGTGNLVKVDELYDIKTQNKQIYRIGRIIADRYTHKNIVLYYYVSDGYISGNQIEIRKHVMMKRLSFKRASAAFVRIMMPVENKLEVTNAILEDFFLKTLDDVVKYTDTNIAMKNQQKGH